LYCSTGPSDIESRYSISQPSTTAATKRAPLAPVVSATASAAGIITAIG
jgi:hypothetical protein